MKSAKISNQNGFSLVELMIVVGIIGILATLALPRFKQFQAKAKMGEAKNILSHIYSLEQTYALDNNSFIAITSTGANLSSPTGVTNCSPDAASGNAKIGFRLDPCPDNSTTAPVPRYSYSTTTATASTFTAQAITGDNENNRICPGNSAHKFALNEQNIMVDEPVIGKDCAK